MCTHLQGDDDEGLDDTICMLPSYYGGNVDENSICGWGTQA